MIYSQSPQVSQTPPQNPIRPIFIHKTTKNKSFLDMHNYLKAVGIKNNAFMLTLLDSDLAGVDPYDPKLNVRMKMKILRECICNYWYV